VRNARAPRRTPGLRTRDVCMVAGARRTRLADKGWALGYLSVNITGLAPAAAPTSSCQPLPCAAHAARLSVSLASRYRHLFMDRLRRIYACRENTARELAERRLNIPGAFNSTSSRVHAPPRAHTLPLTPLRTCCALLPHTPRRRHDAAHTPPPTTATCRHWGRATAFACKNTCWAFRAFLTALPPRQRHLPLPPRAALPVAYTPLPRLPAFPYKRATRCKSKGVRTPKQPP